MDLRRLRLLLDLSRLGSMREVAEELGTTTSSVSQQIAALSREMGTPVIEPVGRRVRLTPAGRRLADHAVTILAAVEAARLDLDPTAEPIGVVRVAGFATGIRRSLLPVIAELTLDQPGIRVSIHEYEPSEAFDLLARDEADLALTYDYNLAPSSLRRHLVATELWTTEWGVGVPIQERPTPFASYADRPWIVNSRNTADEDVLRILASMAGFTPDVVHRIDSLDLLDDLIVAGRGIGLLPRDRKPRRGVRILPVVESIVEMRAYAVVREGSKNWPPLRLLLDRLSAVRSPLSAQIASDDYASGGRSITDWPNA